jgi:hypothetical protein
MSNEEISMKAIDNGNNINNEENENVPNNQYIMK